MAGENIVEVSASASPPPEDKDKIIQKLTEEKKALEEKNKRLASILDITAKKVSQLSSPASATESQDAKSAQGGEDIPVSLIKKEIGSLERRIEKARDEQNSDQVNKLLSGLNARFEALENKIEGFNKLGDIEKKLEDIKSIISLHKAANDNLFGMLGKIGGSSDSNPVPDNNGHNLPSPESRAVSSLEELNCKIDALLKHIDALQGNPDNKLDSESKPSGSSQDSSVAKISESMKNFAEKLI